MQFNKYVSASDIGTGSVFNDVAQLRRRRTMKKLLPLLLALCLTLSACAAPAAVPLPGDSVTAVTVTYAGKTVTCTDPAQVRAMTDAARSL